MNKNLVTVLALLLFTGLVAAATDTNQTIFTVTSGTVCSLSSNTTEHNFGTLNPGQYSAEVEINLTNIGNIEMNISVWAGTDWTDGGVNNFDMSYLRYNSTNMSNEGCNFTHDAGTNMSANNVTLWNDIGQFAGMQICYRVLVPPATVAATYTITIYHEATC